MGYLCYKLLFSSQICHQYNIQHHKMTSKKDLNTNIRITKFQSQVFDTQDGPKSFLVGVVSFGPTICGIRKPGVYTSIKFFLGWILDNL